MSKEEMANEKRKLCADKHYSKLYTKAFGKLRRYGINPEVPGYTLIVYAVCIRVILDMDIDEDIYQLLEKVTIVPSVSTRIKNVYPAEQWMREALKAVGINTQVMDFVEEISKQCVSEIKIQSYKKARALLNCSGFSFFLEKNYCNFKKNLIQ